MKRRRLTEVEKECDCARERSTEQYSNNTIRQRPIRSDNTKKKTVYTPYSNIAQQSRIPSKQIRPRLNSEIYSTFLPTPTPTKGLLCPVQQQLICKQR
jgi:hypothetical protein